MRLLMITDFYWPYEGGVEQHVRRLSQELAARGHEVTVFTLQPAGLPAFEYDGQVRVQRVKSTLQRATWLFAHPERPWAPPFPDPGVTRDLLRVIRQERPDIVHGHDWLARSFLPLKAASGARFVMSLHYYTLSCAKKSLMYKDTSCNGPGFNKCPGCAAEHYGPGKGIPIALANWIMSAAERAAVDMFLPVSQATADGNGLSSNDRYQIIPNFMPGSGAASSDGAVDSDGAAGGDMGTYLEQLPDQEFLLFVGDLRRNKGIEVLLSAYAGLGQAPPLVLIGKVWTETPRAFPPNTVVLKNWPNQAVLAAWERSLLGIVPSLWPEPFGIVAIEALAAGRPVIASKIGGLQELVADGETGLLVPPGDPLALREAIAYLLAHPEQRLAMGKAGKRKANGFQAQLVVPRIEAVYRSLLAGDHEERYQRDGSVVS